MKFESRLLISQLCAAGATGLLSASFIAGCASGERAGKFWNQGDVGSSDAYAAAALARDQSFAANPNPTLPAAGDKVAPAGGTKDGTGHVAIPDASDTPPPPLVSDSDPSASAPAQPAPSTAPTSNVAAGSAITGAAAAGVAAGSVQVAGAAAGGRIIAPYVQKRPPSGVVDNNSHDSEIVKPKQVLAKQLDPFAETDAPLYGALNSMRPTAAPASAGVGALPAASTPIVSPPASQGVGPASVAPVAMNATPVNPASVGPVPVDPTPANSAPADPTPVDSMPVNPASVRPALVSPTLSAASNPVAAPAGRVAIPNANGFGESDGTMPARVPTKPETNPGAPLSASTEPPAVPAAPPTVVSAPPSDAFDPSLPAEPVLPRASTGGPTSSNSATTASPLAPQPPASFVPSATAPSKSAYSTVPSRPRIGVRLGDEDLDTELKEPPHREDRPVVEPASTDAAPQLPTSDAAAAPYEVELHHEESTRPCVVPPSPPAPHPTGTTAPSKSIQDTWESRKSSTPAAEPAHAAVAPPVAVTAAPSVPVEQTLAPPASPTPASASAASSEMQTIKQARARESRAADSHSVAAAHVVPAPVGSEAALLQSAVPGHASRSSAAAEHESFATSPSHVEAVVGHAGVDPMVYDSASIHGRYTGDESAPSSAAPQSDAPQNAAMASPPKSQPAAAPAVPAKPIPSAARRPVKQGDSSPEGKSASFWDESQAAPAGKHTVSTAEFSVAAPSLPVDADGVRPTDAKPVGVSAGAPPGNASSKPGPAGSRAGLLVGMAIGLAMSAVVWRRWRHSGQSVAN
jgi:hypothetical protein